MRTSKADRLSDAHAHRALLRLYEARVPYTKVVKDGHEVRRRMTQKEFGEAFGLGSQGMVWQYLHGDTPLTVEAAARFARGLGCTIDDISPVLAQALRRDILPVLARAALVLIALFVLPPKPAEAAVSFNIIKDTLHIAGCFLLEILGLQQPAVASSASLAPLC